MPSIVQVTNLENGHSLELRVNGSNLFRVRLGPITSVDEADKMLARVLASGLPDARIVVD